MLRLCKAGEEDLLYYTFYCLSIRFAVQLRGGSFTGSNY
jgi:hypothetical protein